MWVRDNKVWYEAELIERIKKECQEAYDNNDKFYNLAQRILEIIQENKR